VNHPAILLWSLICLFAALLIFSPFAEGFDYVKTHGKKGWEYAPLICIVDVRPELKYYTIKAVDSWEREFNKHGVYDYDYNIKLTKGEEINCDAIITFGDVNEVWENSKTNVGAAICYENFKLKSSIGAIREGARFCKVVINPDYEAGKHYYITVVHEMGHVLGLGHRLPFESKSFPAVVLTNDIMHPWAAQFKRITSESLDAIQFMYNYSGWNGMINANYTIPHDS